MSASKLSWMIRPEDFQIRIDYDGDGPLVIVRHPITSTEKRGRPAAAESVGALRDRLVREITGEFCDEADIIFHCGHGRRDGKAYDLIGAEHKPTGLVIGMRRLNGQKPHEAKNQVLDELVAEVWRRKMEDSKQT